HHPAGVGAAMAATFFEGCIMLIDFLSKIQVAQGESSGHIRKESSESITDSRTYRNEIMSLERVAYAKCVPGSWHSENARVAKVAEPQVRSVSFQAEHPVVDLIIVSDQAAKAATVRVQ